MPNNPNYVNPGEDMESAWGNKVVGRTVPIFDTAAERDLALPAPERGQLAATLAATNNPIQYFDGSSWNGINRPGHDNLYAPKDAADVTDVETAIDGTVSGSEVVVVASKTYNVVTLAFHCATDTDGVPYLTTLGTIPAEYRPGADYLTFYVVDELGDGSVRAIWLYLDGRIQCGTLSGNKKYRGTFTYAAGAHGIPVSP